MYPVFNINYFSLPQSYEINTTNIIVPILDKEMGEGTTQSHTVTFSIPKVPVAHAAPGYVWRSLPRVSFSASSSGQLLLVRGTWLRTLPPQILRSRRLRPNS